MLPLSVSTTLEETINQITSNFENNLRDDFINYGVRQQRSPKRHYQLDNILIIDGNISTELSNLNITDFSPCNLDNFHVNLKMLNISINANMEQIKIEGNFKQSSINTLIPMEKAGKVLFTVKGVKYDGQIGIYVVEDSFMAKNYDIHVSPTTITTEVSCIDGTIVENSNVIIGAALTKHIFVQLIDFFYWKILFEQLAAAIVEYSVGELFLDQPEEITALCLERASNANSKTDQLLTKMNEYFEKSSKGIVEIAPLCFIIDEGGKRQTIITQNGELQDLSTCIRIDNMSVYEEQGIQYIYGNIKLRVFKFKYLFGDIKTEAGSNGQIEVKAYRSQILIKLSLHNYGDSTKMAVNNVQAVNLRDVDFNTVNLEVLDAHYDLIESCVMGAIRGNLFPLLEDKIREGLTHAINSQI